MPDTPDRRTEMTETRPFRTAEEIRAAIDEACPLHNPRLSEVDWAAVGRAFDARQRAGTDDAIRAALQPTAEDHPFGLIDPVGEGRYDF